MLGWHVNRDYIYCIASDIFNWVFPEISKYRRHMGLAREIVEACPIDYTEHCIDENDKNASILH